MVPSNWTRVNGHKLKLKKKNSSEIPLKHKKQLFHNEGGQTLEQVYHRGSEEPLGDIQNPIGYRPDPPDLSRALE